MVVVVVVVVVENVVVCVPILADGLMSKVLNIVAQTATSISHHHA